MSGKEKYHILDPEFSDPKRLKREREKARELRKTQWWLDQLNRGICHYCGKQFPGAQLTMDHIVPLARGGSSTRGNIVAACRECNQKKKLDIPAEEMIEKL
jgi:5-methylcytosine-specific restriction protein A